MGNKEEGFKTDHLLSKCCQEIIRFKPTSNGYSIQVWCENCGNYVFNGRTESLIALWIGNKEAIIKNIGFIPSWLEKIEKDKEEFRIKISNLEKYIIERDSETEQQKDWKTKYEKTKIKLHKLRTIQ